jgi:hypothetical protein
MQIVAIRANAVVPGATIAPINALWKDDAAKRSMFKKYIPIGRSAESGWFCVSRQRRC